jgi:hypothetical protein
MRRGAAVAASVASVAVASVALAARSGTHGLWHESTEWKGQIIRKNLASACRRDHWEELDQATAQGDTRVMGVFAEPSVDGWPDARQLDELLDEARVRKDARTRNDLHIALLYARSSNISEQEAQEYPPRELLDQLQKSILKTRLLLQRLEGLAYTRNIGWEIHSLESEVVKGLSLLVPGKHSEPPKMPDRMIIGINMQNLLRAWQDSVKKIPRRKRGKPERRGELAIVFYALEFFCRHSARKPSNDPKNPFPVFAERFYETITGTEPRNLDWQIRQVLKERLRAGD